MQVEPADRRVDSLRAHPPRTRAATHGGWHHVPLRHRRHRGGPVPAREVAGEGDVSIHGGATTINQYLAAGLIDELRLHIVPVTLGSGTRLFEGVPRMNLEEVSSRAASAVTHLTYRVRH
jgi:RibD C-terminal domain